MPWWGIALLILCGVIVALEVTVARYWRELVLFIMAWHVLEGRTLTSAH